MSIGRVLHDTFWPGGPGYALTLFVLIVVVGFIVAFTLRWKGDYVKARITKRWINLTAFAVAFVYLIGWIGSVLKRIVGW